MERQNHLLPLPSCLHPSLLIFHFLPSHSFHIYTVCFPPFIFSHLPIYIFPVFPLLPPPSPSFIISHLATIFLHYSFLLLTFPPPSSSSTVIFNYNSLFPSPSFRHSLFFSHSTIPFHSRSSFCSGLFLLKSLLLPPYTSLILSKS